MRLSVAVMAHPTRAPLVADLLDRLSLEERHVVWDRDNCEWDTGERSWWHHDPIADWHLVIQDDAMPCRDLLAGLAVALTDLPTDSVVSLYSAGRTRAWRQAERVTERARRRWIRQSRLVWGVALAVPTTSIGDMLAWASDRSDLVYDTSIACYYQREMGWPAFYTWPSLVDHRQVPSLIGHPLGRQANQFLDENASALDWAGQD